MNLKQYGLKLTYALNIFVSPWQLMCKARTCYTARKNHMRCETNEIPIDLQIKELKE